MNRLQKALGINFLFSGISGLGLIVFHKSIANLFGIEQNYIFWMIGIGLIFFALTILYEVKKQRRLAVQWIVIQDFIWVVGSAILLILKPFNISNTGNNLITIVAIIVFLMAISQSIALAQIKNNNDFSDKLTRNSLDNEN